MKEVKIINGKLVVSEKGGQEVEVPGVSGVELSGIKTAQLPKERKPVKPLKRENGTIVSRDSQEVRGGNFDRDNDIC